MRNRLLLVSLLAVACGLVSVPSAFAVPKCEGPVSQKVLYTGQGMLESVAAGAGGKFFVSGTAEGATEASLFRYDSPGQERSVVATAGPGPGGLAWMGKRLIWGNGNTVTGGMEGDENPQARLLKVDPKTGKVWTWAKGLGMANGVARGPKGVIFASNDFGSKLDRISPKGVTNHGWAQVESGNGMVVSRDGKYLFVNQTFVNPGSITRIEIAKPSNAVTYFSAAGLDNEAPAFDGLTRDNAGNLYAAAWIAGQVWKITPKREVCVLATGISQVSNLIFGGGKKGFTRGRLYAVNFLGEIVQINGARRATVPKGV